MVQQGMDAPAIVTVLESLQKQVDASFVLQTLEYLKKGGRCSGIVALGANLLSLRPEIEVIDGKMQVGKKYRGKMEKTILDYVRGRLANRDDILTHRIIVTHSHVPQEILDKVLALVRELQPFEEVLVTEAGCTISSHCGPNCLGVLFLRRES